MTWSADDIPDQSGRVAVVTGANGGLGLETTRELARRGAHLVMAARNQEKAEEANGDIAGGIPEASLEIQPLDLGSVKSIHAFAEVALGSHRKIDLLINNAGVMATPRRETADGFELQLGTNHLGHFVLTALLMPALLRAGKARVVTTTSTARYFGGSVDPDDPHLEKNYDPWKAYGRSKRANLHFALELNRRLISAGSDVRSFSADPGYSNTDLQAQSVHASEGGFSQRFFHTGVRLFGMSPSDGALPQLRAATDSDAAGGTLYAPRWVSFGPPIVRGVGRRLRKPDEMATLWALSQRETGVTFDVAELVKEAAQEH